MIDKSSMMKMMESDGGTIFEDERIVAIIKYGSLEVHDHADNFLLRIWFFSNLEYKYLKKFLEVMTVAVKQSLPGEPWSTNSLPMIDVSYNTSSEKTIRKILNSRRLSALAKFSSVISLLYVCPTLPFRDVRYIANKTPIVTLEDAIQTNDVENNHRVKKFTDLQYFLIPSFATLEYVEYYSNKKINADPEFFRFLVSLTSFFLSPTDRTYGEWLNSSESKRFLPEAEEYRNFSKHTSKFTVIKAICSYIDTIETPNVDSSLHDLKAWELIRFMGLYSTSRDELLPFLKDRVKTCRLIGELSYPEREVVEILKYPESEIKRFDAYTLFDYLSTNEMLEFCEQLERFSQVESTDKDYLYRIIDDLRSIGASISAYYYLHFGFEAMIELILFSHTDKIHPDFSYMRNDPLTRKNSESVNINNLIYVKTSEYSDLPLDWAMTLIEAESSSVNHEQTVKI